MKWSESAWKAIELKYQSILQMPFILELSDGSLPKEKFKFYMTQDSLYLEHFGRTLSLIGTKLGDVQDALSYIRFAEAAIVVENALHEFYFKDFGVTDRGTAEPSCHHYIHYLRSTAAFDPVEVAMAATLPCFWIYKKVGDHIYNHPQSVNNPYQQWIEMYGSEEFAESVKNAIRMCDEAAENTTLAIRKRMKEAFITAAYMEYDFWVAAYDMRVWDKTVAVILSSIGFTLLFNQY